MNDGEATGAESRPGSPEEPSQEAQALLLHVLSPSAEVPDKLTFSSIPVTTTVAELKARIQDAIPSMPSPARQRLIYRGKALVKDTDTLKDVFGQETIDDPVAHALHLVLPPPSAPSSSSRPMTTPAHPLVSALPSNGLPSPPSPHRSQPALGLHAGAQPGQQAQHIIGGGGHPGTHHHHLQHIHGHNGMTPLQGHIQSQIQTALNNHFAALSQQLGQQLAMGAVNSPGTTSPSGQLNQSRSASNEPQLSFQQVLAQQQQGRAAAGMPGVTGTLGTNTSNGIAGPRTSEQPSTEMPASLMDAPHRGLHAPFHGEQTSNNNSSLRITVNETITIPRMSVGPNAALSSDPAPSNSSNGNGASGRPTGGLDRPTEGAQSAGTQPHPAMPFMPPSGVMPSNPTLRPSILNLEQRVSNLERALMGNLPAIRNQNSTPGPGPRGQQLAQQSMRPDPFQRHPLRHLNAGGSLPQDMRPVPNSLAPTVYLLSSPSGPHALLFSPLGLYNSRDPTSTNVLDAPRVATALPIPQHAQNHVPNRGNNVNVQHAPPQPQPGHAHAAQPHLRQAAQPRDLARILLPLGGHLWLLIRLFGFVYFFTGGGGWRRAVILGLGALLVFIAQTGIFRPFQQAILDPLRDHLEGLVPLAGPNRRPVNGAPGNARAGGPIGEAGAPVNEVDVRQAAERFIREREERDMGTVRQFLRRFERSLAIFFASLVPGIGERHIAAQDAAEALRLAQQRERDEERARREGQAQEEEAEAGGPSGNQPGSSGDVPNREDNADGIQERPQGEEVQQPQQPLIEI